MLGWRSKPSGSSTLARSIVLDAWGRDPAAWVGGMNKRQAQCYACRVRHPKGTMRKIGVAGSGVIGFLCRTCRQGLTAPSGAAIPSVVSWNRHS